MWTVPHLSVTALTNLVLAPILYPSQVSASESVLLDLRSANLANLGFLTRVQLRVRLHGMGHEQKGHADFLSDHISVYTNAPQTGTY